MPGRSRDKVRKGYRVQIVQKRDQRSGKLTEGIIKRVLTNSNYHPHGMKVQLETGEIGRVKHVWMQLEDS